MSMLCVCVYKPCYLLISGCISEFEEEKEEKEREEEGDNPGRCEVSIARIVLNLEGFQHVSYRVVTFHHYRPSFIALGMHSVCEARVCMHTQYASADEPWIEGHGNQQDLALNSNLIALPRTAHLWLTGVWQNFRKMSLAHPLSA